MKGFFVVFLTVLVMGWMTAAARSSKARRVGQDWVFPPVLALQAVCIFLFVVGMTLIFIGFGAPDDPQANSTIIVSCGFLFVASVIVGWPKQIWLSESGLKQRSWYGGWKTLSWSDVSGITEKRDGSVVVLGKQGKIVLSQFHSDREAFLIKAHRHTNSDG